MFKIAIAFFIVFGAIVWGQRYAGTWITEHAAQLPEQQPFPAAPTVTGFDSASSRPMFNPAMTPMGHIPATRP